MAKYRPSYHFQTTVKVPCPLCNQMTLEEDVKKRAQYVYRIGYIDANSCEPCFKAKVAEAQKQSDAMEQKTGYQGEYGFIGDEI